MMYKKTRSKRGGKVIYSLVEALNTRTPRLTIAKKKSKDRSKSELSEMMARLVRGKFLQSGKHFPYHVSRDLVR